MNKLLQYGVTLAASGAYAMAAINDPSGHPHVEIPNETAPLPFVQLATTTSSSTSTVHVVAVHVPTSGAG